MNRMYVLKRKHISSRIKNNKGTTMVETLVAFVVLLIVMAALYGMVRIATNLRLRAVDTASIRTEFISEIYKTTPSNVAIHEYMGRSDGNLYMFSLKLNSDKTSDDNLFFGESSENDYSQSIRLTDLDATGYVSEDSRISGENLATPKALIFSYHK